MNISSTPEANDRCNVRRLAGSVLFALAVFPLGGQCGAPFETEDPNTVSGGQVELRRGFAGFALGGDDTNTGFDRAAVFDGHESSPLLWPDGYSVLRPSMTG